MRATGLSSFPDLRRNGMRIAVSGQTISVNGIAISAPAFSAGRQKCERHMPHTDASPAQAAQQRKRGLEFARCMRSHGVSNFPDPELSGASGGGNQAARLPGVTDGELQAPAFQAAAKACGGGPKGP
jgi:hypothetical protein